MNLAEILLVWLMTTGAIVLLYWVHTLGWPGVVLASVILAGAFTAVVALVAHYAERLAGLTKLLNGEDEDAE